MNVKLSHKNIPYLSSDQLTPKTASTIPLNEQQQELLDKFRERLPELINPDTSVHDDKAFCDDACLLRYLRATKWDLDSAFHRLLATLEWRRRYQPHKITLTDIREEGVTGKTYINGFDLENHPILYMVPARNNTTDPESYIMHMVFNLETIIKSMPKDVGKYCLIMDLRNLSMKDMVSETATRVRNSIPWQHYPERVAKIFLVEAPWIFWGFYKMVSPLLDPKTKQKVFFVNLKDMESDSVCDGYVKLSDYIGKKYLYKDFGGNNPYQFKSDPYFNQMEEFLNKIN